MILTERISIKIDSKLDRTYYKLGYYDKSITIGIIELYIDVKDLNNSSREYIKVKCDICGEEKEITYYKYLDNIKKYGIYSCSTKCSSFKNKLTKKEKYGDENYNNRDKSKETCLEKYGVENVQQDNDIKEKTNNTNIEKYGNSTLMKNDIIKNKQQKTMLEKYGNVHALNIDVFKDDSKNTKKDKYGDENYNNRYKCKETNIEKYGFENPMMNKEIKDKTKKTRLEKGSYLTDEQRTEYRNYWLKVKVITNKHKKELFENWDGLDYYDGEYIKDNFILPSGSKEYPTIDHKTSVNYGYINDILPEEIGKLENLCITKRTINSSKNKKNDYI